MRPIIAALCAIVLGGCATAPSGPYQEDPHHSRAWNVLTAKQVPVKWVPDDAAVPDDQRDQLRLDVPWTPIAAGAGAVSPLAGLSSFQGALFGGLTTFFLAPAEPAPTPYIVAWMPTSDAASAEAATAAMDSLAIDALRESLADTDFPEGYKVQEVRKQYPGGLVHHFSVVGGDCDADKVACHYDATTRPAVAGRAPSWHDGAPAWVTSVLLTRSHVDSRDFLPTWRATFPDLAVYRAMSERLPKWAYLYMPARSTSYFDPESQSFKLLQFPLMLNQGQPLYFIKPEA